MVGRAVAITVASRFSMKKVTATTQAIRRVCMLRPVSVVTLGACVVGNVTDAILIGVSGC
ncbi:hypothetical protein D3C72_1782920 [compost metagenome]